jgi:putative ATPase
MATGDLFNEEDDDRDAAAREEISAAAQGNEGGSRPLADRLRPATFEDFLGQGALVGEDTPLRRLIHGDRVPSMILWGPPGSGKTTLAHLIARETRSDFLTLSAVLSGVKEVRSVVEIAKANRLRGRRTLLFVDEIHRFNKAQQDAFLPHVESGLITLIGATTENPSFAVIAPLLSRCRVFTLQALGEEHLLSILWRGLAQLQAHARVHVGEDAMQAIASLSDGDARRALGMLEVSVDAVLAKRTQEGGGEEPTITREDVAAAVQRHLVYDRAGEEHYNLISALHKTLRSSDPDAAVYWCERMLAAGEDPRYVLRRLVRFASEDVGLADPNAIVQAVACQTAFEKVGSPEGDLFVTQLALYLALTPKSNAVYRAAGTTRALIRETGTQPVPFHLRNAPTKLMKELGYGEGYTYDHDAEEGFIAKQGLPDALDGTILFDPGPRGWEGRLKERLEELRRARKEKKG